jgi:hypothetical protein
VEAHAGWEEKLTWREERRKEWPARLVAYCLGSLYILAG